MTGDGSLAYPILDALRRESFARNARPARFETRCATNCDALRQGEADE
jgi:hypothetical protein